MKIAVKLAFDEHGAVRLLNWLAQENAIILRAQPDLPLLYDSGVVYRRETDETWCDYLNMLAQGHEDCDGLAAARAGELIAKGWQALRKGDQGFEQAQQIGDLSAFVDGTASGPVVLLGDFNNGPDQHAAHYADLSQGFVSPYVRDSGVCTYCADNPLNSEDSEDRVIDHVLLRDVDLDSASERVLDEPVEIEVCGEAQDGAYSDHYGVRVTIGG